MNAMRVRILSVVAVLLLLPFLAAALYMGARYPAAAIPALLGALVGSFVFARARHSFDPLNQRSEAFQLYGACTWPALFSGALGYGVLAAAGIGVPNPDAALPWRLFGGLVFGALAGVIAGWVVALVSGLVLIGRMARQFRRERGAA